MFIGGDAGREANFEQAEYRYAFRLGKPLSRGRATKMLDRSLIFATRCFLLSCELRCREASYRCSISDARQPAFAFTHALDASLIRRLH